MKRQSILFLAMISLFAFSQSWAAAATAGTFSCPATLTCKPAGMSTPTCYGPMPPAWMNWKISAVMMMGYPIFNGPYTVLHFTNAQDNYSSSNCNYAWNDGSNGSYVLIFSASQYAANLGSASQWVRGSQGNRAYCYALGVNDTTYNDPRSCPFTSK